MSRNRRLYITYDSSELSNHGLELCEEAVKHGWEVTDGPRSVIKEQRESEAATHDALILLCGWTYGFPRGQAPHEMEWDAVIKAGKPARALMVDEKAPWWPERVVDGRNSPGLEALREKLRSSASPRGFNSIAASVREIAGPELDFLKNEIQRKQAVKVFVVWDFTIVGLELILSAIDKRPPEGIELTIPGLKNRGAAGEIFRNIIVPGIHESDRVLVVTDRPNANVAFEAGIALGFGKQLSLVHFGPVPPWLGNSGLKGHVVNEVADGDAIRRTIQSPNCWYTPKPVEPVPKYGATLFLSPGKYIGATLREEQQVFDATWLAPYDTVAVEDLNSEFRQVSRVVWSIAAYPEGLDSRDGAENSSNGLVAGWFFARAYRQFGDEAVPRLLVFRQKESRVILDVVPVVREFETLDEYTGLLGKVPDALPTALPLEISSKGAVGYEMVLVPPQGANTGGNVWVGVAPVRNREYRVFCKATQRALPEHFHDPHLDEEAPVVRISASEALDFCAWLSSKAGLPDPALWWRCALAGETRYKYWWGDDETILKKVAYHSDNAGVPPKIQPAGKLRANPWGLKDVFGNVWEWTKPYEKEVERPTSLGERVKVRYATILGGAFNTAPGGPKERESEAAAKDDNIGFRCVWIE